jgi:hypothetical protein
MDIDNSRVTDLEQNLQASNVGMLAAGILA